MTNNNRTNVMVANRLTAIIRMLAAGHVDMAMSYYTSSLYLGLNPVYVAKLPKLEIKAAVHAADTQKLSELSNSLLSCLEEK